MQYQGRGNPSYRGGRGNPSYRGGRSNQNKILAQFGNKKLIASNIGIMGLPIKDDANNEMEEYLQWKTQKKDTSSSSPSYATVVNKHSEETMVKNYEERVILLLNENDKKWEDQPWTIYERYLSPHGYTMDVYKSQKYYETILEMNNCEVTHFTSPNTKEVYNFSKIIIKRIISMEDWGISPYKEKTLSYNGSPFKYNYWDYIQAFDKTFLYENDKQSHTWFIKISQEVYNQFWPSWFIKWWQFYGTTEEILPEIFKEYFDKWREVIPQDIKKFTGIIQMKFFIEFSIPWIWRNYPITGYTQDNIFCLKRKSCSRFWETMMRENPQTKQLNCQETLDLLKEKIGKYQIQKIGQEKQASKTADKIIEDLDDDTLSQLSNEEIVQRHLQNLKKILANKAKMENNRSDTSMAGSSQQEKTSDISIMSRGNSFDILRDAQDCEDDEEINLISIMDEEAIRAYILGGRSNDEE